MFATTWINLANVFRESGWTQAEQRTILFLGASGCRAGVGGEGRGDCYEYRFLSCGDRSILKLVVVSVQLCEHTGTHPTVHFR